MLEEQVQRSWQGTARARRIDALFDALREGFGVCEMIRDADGHVVDYWIREANPAFLKPLGGEKALGKKLSELRPDISRRWFDRCEKVLTAGVPQRIEYFDPGHKRWYDSHLTPLSKDELIMFYVDVTHRKLAEKRQEELFHELNHRVKNNLNVVSAMLALQAKSADAATSHALSQAVNRIHTIADVHSILYRTGSLERVSFDGYLNDLCGRLGQSMSDGRISIAVEAQAVRVTMDRAVQLGIIVNELITNAAKHAYGAHRRGEVKVRFAQVGEVLELGVRDFGPGLPANEGQRGLGMKLVRSLVQQCGGVLVLGPGPGADLCVRLPVADGEPEQAPLL